jgi:hypothetical protein
MLHQLQPRIVPVYACASTFDEVTLVMKVMLVNMICACIYLSDTCIISDGICMYSMSISLYHLSDPDMLCLHRLHN